MAHDKMMAIKRHVIERTRITYTFTMDQVVEALVAKGKDHKTGNMLPNPAEVTGIEEQVTLTYIYDKEGDPDAKG